VAFVISFLLRLVKIVVSTQNLEEKQNSLEGVYGLSVSSMNFDERMDIESQIKTYQLFA
jgi:hypothetical protein